MRRTVLAVAFMAALVVPSGHAPAQSSITVEADLRYARRGGVDLTLDAYLPPGGGSSRPAVVWIHGGRWTEGDKADPSDVETAATLAENGFVAFSVNYRLANAGGFPYPAAVEDVVAAVGWIREHAEEFGVDPARIAAAGNSSGGHLAAMLGTLGEGPLDQGARVAAVVTFSGLFDLEALFDAPNPNVQEAVSTFLRCEADCDEIARAASPITQVDATDAPMFMTNATEEPIPLSQATSMADALEAAGVEARVIEVPGTHHGLAYVSWEKLVGPTHETLPALYLTFLGEHLGIEVSPREPSALPTGAVPAASMPPKTAPTEGAEDAQRPVKGTIPEPEDDGVNSALLVATIIAVIVAIVSSATALRLLGRSRRRRAAEPPVGGERPREPAGQKR